VAIPLHLSERSGGVGAGTMRPEQREALILEHLPLVRALARRYANRGEPVDDLEQAGTIGLIKAVDRFDTAKGDDFRSFATPTILGEIRRHFRDKTWAVRVPRGLKDDYSTVVGTVSALTGRIGRSPTIPEIAEEAGLTEEQVLDAIAAHGAYRPRSLSQPPRTMEDEGPIEIPTEESGYETAEGRHALRKGLQHLPPRERVILHLRFEEGMIQSDIAKVIGISQMHVSRLISRALETLRRVAEEGEP
jgi:RNA polymerase sigma-B factor